MNYIGIDYGTKRVGIAVCDETGSLAFPLEVVPTADAVARVVALARERGTDTAILGEPAHHNDVWPQVEQYKRELESLGLAVVLEPEHYTSALAARQFAPEEKSRKANPAHAGLDASAAALILQSYLDRRKKVE